MQINAFPFRCTFSAMRFYFEAQIGLMSVSSPIMRPREYSPGRYYRPGHKEWLRDQVATLGLSLKDLSQNEENALARWYLKPVPWEDLNKRVYFNMLASALVKIGGDLRERDGVLECYKKYRNCTAKCVESKVLPRHHKI